MTEPRSIFPLGKLKKPQLSLLITAGAFILLGGISVWLWDSCALKYVREGDFQVEKSYWL